MTGFTANGKHTRTIASINVERRYRNVITRFLSGQLPNFTHRRHVDVANILHHPPSGGEPMHLGWPTMTYRQFVVGRYSAEITDHYCDQLDGIPPNPSLFLTPMAIESLKRISAGRTLTPRQACPSADGLPREKGGASLSKINRKRRLAANILDKGVAPSNTRNIFQWRGGPFDRRHLRLEITPRFLAGTSDCAEGTGATIPLYRTFAERH